MRTLLTPRWLGRHVLAIGLVVGFLVLGRWQWGRGLQQSGTLQNLGYAAEWWLLAVLVVYGWGRLALDVVRPDRDRHRIRRLLRRGPDTVAPAVGPGVEWGSTQGPDVVGEQAPDAELDAYNDYLARLNARNRG